MYIAYVHTYILSKLLLVMFDALILMHADYTHAYTVDVYMHSLCVVVRELGLINEAERLLNDMCSLYCPEKWTMFSANAVSLLAECQKSLNLDYKYPICGIINAHAAMYVCHISATICSYWPTQILLINKSNFLYSYCQTLCM